MSFLSRLTQPFRTDPMAVRAAVAAARADAVLPLVPKWDLGKAQWLPGDPTTYDREGYRKVALIFRCVQYVANAAGAAPVRVYLDRGAGEPEEQRDHPLRQLMLHPNPMMGESRFLAFVSMTMNVAGYCLIEKQRDGLGNVVGLWPLRSDWARPIPRGQGVVDWEYRVPGYDPRILPDADVIPLTYADTPDNGITGIGPLAAILRETGIANALTDFLKTFLDRGALPLYVAIPSDDPRLASQLTDQAKRKSFEEAWRQRYGGLTRATDPLVLAGYKDVKPLGYNFDELAYPELRNLSDAAICQGFGIPPILVGAPLGLERSTFSNTAEARRSFYEDTMTFHWGRIDDAFTRHLLPEFVSEPGYDLRFDVSNLPALKDDENPKWERATAAFTAGLISRHTAQREAGVETHGPDVFLVPFSVTEQPVTNGQRGKAMGTVRVALLSEDEIREIVTYPARTALPELAIVTRDGRRYVNERALSPQQMEQRAKLAAHNRTVQAKLSAQLTPKLADFFRQQGERIVPLIVGQRGLLTFQETTDLSGDARNRTFAKRAVEQVDWDAEYQQLRDLLIRFYGEATAAAFDLASEQLGTDIPWDISNPTIRNLLEQLGTRIAGISEVTRQTVEQTVVDALSEGTSIDELAGKLRGLFEETYQGRAATVARTESQVALNMSTAEGYIAGGVKEVEILDNERHDTDPGGDGLTCAQRAGLVTSVRNVALHSGGTHPNCIMAIRPIIEVPA